MPDTSRDLYRAIHKDGIEKPFVIDDQPKEGLLYPRWETTTYQRTDGSEGISRADVRYRINADTKEKEVRTGGGTSLHDAAGMLGFGSFSYFQIPSGTSYPASITIAGGGAPTTSRNGKVTARHYQIEVVNPMTVDAFKGALDTFARNAVARQVELAK